MKRTEFFAGTLAAGALAATSSGARAATGDLGNPLHPPASGPVNVGLVMGPNLVTIDLFGPGTAFADGDFDGTKMVGRFMIYTVAGTREPIDIGFGKMQADFTFDNAPKPHVLVVPQQDSLPETLAYIKKASANADVTMSVCTGAFVVARAGLFDGGRATTHHSAYDRFAKEFPNVTLIRDVRYVEDPRVSSSGGEACGIDLALRVVERYYGRTAARVAARTMEYPYPQA
jgi:transcriptional regulator GlxA family with amidase domain